MTVRDKSQLRESFTDLYNADVRFSTLLSAFLRFTDTTQTQIALMAHSNTRTVRSCIQGDASPTPAIIQAFQSVLGFDPWAVRWQIDKHRGRLHADNYKTLRELQTICNDNIDDSSEDVFSQLLESLDKET